MLYPSPHTSLQDSTELHTRIGIPKDAIQELEVYFFESFGNYTRIDYGSGHELNFFAWLFCLLRLKIFEPSDFVAIVFSVFQNYLKLMRKVQTTYMLEPAG